MTAKRQIVTVVNRVLARFDAKVVRTQADTWDHYFRRWIEDARVAGQDPNDIGDVEWASDGLSEALERWYLPLAAASADIVELGPGSGRLTRHLVAAGARVTVVDRSEFVCEWMRSYLPGIDVRHIVGCHLPLASESMDAFCAHGVFEHLLAEEIYWFLVEGARVLRPGGAAAFNFDNVATTGGLDHLVAHSSPDRVSVFRFHHPDAIAALARRAGFSDVRIETSESRNGFAHLTL